MVGTMLFSFVRKSIFALTCYIVTYILYHNYVAIYSLVKRLPFDWDEQYRIYLEKILQVNEESDFHCILTEFMEILNDGHTKYIPPDSYRVKKPFVRPEEPSYTLSEGGNY